MESSSESPKPVFFFDIDNCLYSRSRKVHELMHDLIDKYFIEHLSLSYEDAAMLHRRYTSEYGLAIEGLVRHHKVDALDYNRKVDDALPLDDVLRPDPNLRRLLEGMDKSKVRLWLFTNAHITHAQRVIRLLDLEGIFEGMTFCDYGNERLICKPHGAAFEKAELESQAPAAEHCYFVDDSYLNAKHAQLRGWTAVHLLEPGDAEPASKASKHQIRSLHDLPGLFPNFFKKSAGYTEHK